MIILNHCKPTNQVTICHKPTKILQNLYILQSIYINKPETHQLKMKGYINQPLDSNLQLYISESSTYYGFMISGVNQRILNKMNELFINL